MVHSSHGRESNPRPRDRKVQPRTTRPQRTKFVSLAFEIMGPSYIWVDHDLDLSVSLDVISHLTIRIPIYHFLLVFHWTQVSIANGFRDIVPQTSCAHRHNAKSSLRVRDITYMYPLCKILVYISISRPHFAYSLCNFHWAPMKNKGCSLSGPRPNRAKIFQVQKFAKF